MPNELEIISPSATDELEAAKARRGELARLLALPHPDACPDGRPLDATLWPKVLSHIAPRVNRISFDIEFATTRLIDDDGAVLTVSVRGSSTAHWLKRQYADIIVDALAASGRGEATVRLVDDPPI
jgi:hypothetical protein